MPGIFIDSPGRISHIFQLINRARQSKNDKPNDDL